jgi:hypothetical protein
VALDKPFFLADRYASFALGTYHERGGAFADLEIHVAGRGVSHTVIPEIDEGVLEVVGEVADQVETVRQVLLDRWSHDKLWSQPNLPMELQSYVVQLVERGQLFVRVNFARSGNDQEYKLVKTRWVPPETMLRRGGRDGEYWEQFSSWRAYSGDGYSVTGDPTDHLYRFDAKEILHLRWPLAEPAGHRAPALAALELEHETARASEQGLLRVRAGAERGECYFPIARARAGAYDGALERQKLLSARARDLLLYPGTDESEVYGWADSTTEFFAADRLLRSRIAICKLREYIFGEFNSQVIDQWRQMNGWRDIRLRLRPPLYSVADWEALRTELHEGSADLEDVRAAVHAESETTRAFNRRWTT